MSVACKIYFLSVFFLSNKTLLKKEEAQVLMEYTMGTAQSSSDVTMVN